MYSIVFPPMHNLMNCQLTFDILAMNSGLINLTLMQWMLRWYHSPGVSEAPLRDMDKWKTRVDEKSNYNKAKKCLINCILVTPYDDIDLGHNWLR